MNRVGKILVGAVLVISIMMTGASVVAFYTHRNWYLIINRKEAEVKPGEDLGLKAQLEAARKRSAELKTQYEGLQTRVQTEDVDRRARMAKMERERAYLNAIYDAAVKELTALKEGERNAIEGAQIAQEKLKGKLEEIDQLRAETAQTLKDRDAAFAEAVALTDHLHEKQGELSRSKASTSMLQRQLAPATVSSAAVAGNAAK